MPWFLLAGLLAGFCVGFIGAGAAVVGLPFLLYLDGMKPDTALGTNALGVALTIVVVLLYRLYKKDVHVGSGLIFAAPGLAGVSLGTWLGGLLPGKEILFLLGFLLFAVAGWMFYLSVHLARAEAGDSDDAATERSAERSSPGRPSPSRRDRVKLGVCGAGVGVACGFFSIGGGFMIIPAIMLSAGFPLLDAIATGLLPFATFSLWIGGEYWVEGSARVLPAVTMMGTGILGGVAGTWLATHISKVKMQRLFAVFMLALGIYMIVQ